MDKQTVINQLKYAIQALSLEADDQLKSFPEFVVVTDELLLEYDNWYNVSTRNYPDCFSDDQIKVLKRISSFFEELPQEDFKLSIAEELETVQFWTDLRSLARDALQKFNWTSEIPPHNRSTYIPS